MKQYKIFFIYWLYFIALGVFFRIILISLFIDDNMSTELIFLYGARMDTIIFSGFSIVFVLLYTFNLMKILKVLLTVFISTYIILEISTITFMDYFLSRPNYLFVEYIKNYNEMLNMVFKLYKVEVIFTIPLVALVIYFSYKYFNKNLKASEIKPKLLALPIILLILALGTRSSIDSSTPSKSFYTFDNSNIHAEIANNTIFSILYSVYLINNEKFYKYGDIKYEDAIKNVKILNNFQTNGANFNRFQKSTFTKKKNVILVILESFGHEYSGYLGGLNTTPNLDKLTKESLYFTNLYAIGTRTSWGVSSVLTGLSPLPSREYVKANKSLNNFYTLASTMKKNNYETTFLYSGDADFDNMRGFFLANGFNNVYGKESFDKNLTKYTWGYCDEDLYAKALGLIEDSKDKPLFITLLTMSSHEPFDYPKGRVEAFKNAKLEGFANSIKYGDFAIGKFIQKLKDKNLLKDTVVAFIADHNPKAYGTFDVPINKYKIVAMIVADEFKNGGKEYKKIASQIDFAPTLLDIAGIDATIPTMGSSVLQNERNSAMLLARKKNFAYLTEKGIVIYKPKKDISMYDYNLKKMKKDEKTVQDGLSYIYSSKYLYDNLLYKIQKREIK